MKFSKVFVSTAIFAALANAQANASNATGTSTNAGVAVSGVGASVIGAAVAGAVAFLIWDDGLVNFALSN